MVRAVLYKPPRSSWRPGASFVHYSLLRVIPRPSPKQALEASTLPLTEIVATGEQWQTAFQQTASGRILSLSGSLYAKTIADSLSSSRSESHGCSSVDCEPDLGNLCCAMFDAFCSALFWCHSCCVPPAGCVGTLSLDRLERRTHILAKCLKHRTAANRQHQTLRQARTLA